MAKTTEVDIFQSEKFIKLEKSTEKLEQPDKFAAVFSQAARTQVKIKDVIRDEIIQVLQTNKDARGTIKYLINEVDRETFKVFLNKLGYVVISSISIIVGALITALVNKLIK